MPSPKSRASSDRRTRLQARNAAGLATALRLHAQNPRRARPWRAYLSATDAKTRDALRARFARTPPRPKRRRRPHGRPRGHARSVRR